MPYVDVLSQEISLDELEPLTCGAIFSLTRMDRPLDEFYGECFKGKPDKQKNFGI